MSGEKSLFSQANVFEQASGKILYLLKYIIIHSKYFPNSDWLKAHA